MSKQTGQIWEWKGDVHGERFIVTWTEDLDEFGALDGLEAEVTSPVYGGISKVALGYDGDICGEVFKQRDLPGNQWLTWREATNLSVATGLKMLGKPAAEVETLRATLKT